MEKNYESLIQALTLELEILHRLRDQVLKAQHCLVQDEIQGLMEALRFQEEIAKELLEAEKKREDLQREVAATLGLRPEATLEELVRSGAKDELPKLVGELRGLVAQIKELNETNRLLAAQSLAYVRKLLEILAPHFEGRSVMLDKNV